MSCDVMPMRVGERKSFAVNYRRELLEFSDAVVTSTWAITPSATLSGATINTTAVTIHGEPIPAYMLTSTYVADVAAGDYVLTNTMTSAQGSVLKIDIVIQVTA